MLARDEGAMRYDYEPSDFRRIFKVIKIPRTIQNVM
jgi:hypothetical protein